MDSYDVMMAVYGNERQRKSALRRWWDRNRIFIKFLFWMYAGPVALLVFQFAVVPDEAMANARIVTIGITSYLAVVGFPLWLVLREEKRSTMDR